MVPSALRAGGTAGLGEQHQGEQSDGFGFVGHQLDEGSPEPDGLGRQIGSRQALSRGGGVTFGVDEVDGGQDRVEPVRELRSAGYAVGGVIVVQFALGPDDPLRHRRLRHQERPGDLVGLEAGEEPQDESDLGVGGEGGVGAQEHEPELVVGDDIDEVVEPVEFGIVVRVHAVGVESVGSEMPLAAG